MLLFYDWSDYSLTLCSVSHSICSSCCCDGRLPTPLPAFEAGNSIAIYVSPDLPKMKGTISQTSFPGSGSGGRQEILQHLAYLGIIINHCTSPFGFGGRPFSPPKKKSKAWGYPPPHGLFFHSLLLLTLHCLQLLRDPQQQVMLGFWNHPFLRLINGWWILTQTEIPGQQVPSVIPCLPHLKVVRPVLVLGVPQPFPVFLLGLGGCTAKTYGKALEKKLVR